jgi:hypothetical protein
MAVSAHEEDVLLPGLICMATAEALDGNLEEATQAGVALVLLAAMRRVFDGIAAEAKSSLEREWGMPRALNAGDGFFALAQQHFLASTGTLPVAQRALALESFDRACQELSVEMNAATPSLSLQSVAASSGALFAGADTALIGSLAGFGRNLNPGSIPDMPESAVSKLLAVKEYITNRSRR